MVHEDVAAPDRLEDVGRAPPTPASGGGVTGDHGSSFSSGRSSPTKYQRSPSREQAVVVHVDLRILDAQLPHQQVAHLVAHGGIDLEPDGGGASLPALEHRLDRGQQVVGLVLLDLDVGVAGHAEHVHVDDVHTREELVEMGGHDLLQRYEPIAVGQIGEPGQQRRDLHPGEAPLARERIADRRSEVQGQARDVGERMRGVDRERREHREDAVAEPPAEEFLVGVRQLLPVHEADAFLLERRQQVAGDQLVRPGLQPRDPFTDRLKLLARTHAVRRRRRHARLDLFLEAGDADLEELVEVLRVDRDELHPFEQRARRVLGERQHAVVEVQPRQLPVDEPGCGLAHWFGEGVGIHDRQPPMLRTGRARTQPSKVCIAGDRRRDQSTYLYPRPRTVTR